MSWSSLLGLLIILGSAGLMAGLALIRKKSETHLREIPAFTRLRQAIGRGVEEGSRLHLSLGHASLITRQSASGLAGLSMLRRLADQTSSSDRPPIATAGEGATSILAQDMLQKSYQEATSGGHYDASASRLTGLTPFSYAAGTLPVLLDESVSANILIGSFGVEASLIMDAAERHNAYTTAASNDLQAQAVLYASAEEPLIGEELFASGAYFGAGRFHTASLQVQDVLRWLMALVILAGALLEMTGGL